MEDIETPLISITEIRRFIIDCLSSVSVSPEAAEAQARLLSEADARGHFGHGINRLQSYMHDITNGLCDPKAKPVIINETDSTAWIDAKNCLGAYSGIFCMERAMDKAKKTGVGWVTCKNANHNGVEAFYSLMAIRKGLIGLCFTNTAPLIVPTRAKNVALGMNPICIGAPGQGNDYFLLDMAASAVAIGKIEEKVRKQEALPEGWAIDEKGQPITDAEAALKKPLLLPLGGSEEHSGHKGTGLAILVEVLCGITSGSKFGPYIQRWITKDSPSNLGQCYIAVDPKCFAPGFEERMTCLLDFIRNLPPLDPDKPVLIPGDWERINMLKVKKYGGIRYPLKQLDDFSKIASMYGIQPMKDINGRMIGAGGTGGYVCKSECAKRIA